MKVLHIINSPKMGGAENLVARLIPYLQRLGADADVLFLTDDKTPLLESLKAETGGKVMTLGARRIYNPLLAFKIIPYLRRYDAIHVHLFPALYWTALAKMLSFSRAKLIYTEHSTTNNRRGKTLFRLLDNVIYGRYNRIVAISDEVKQELQRHISFDANRFEVIGNGIPLDAIRSAQPYAKSDFFHPDDKLLMQVSSFRPPKDQMTLIGALAKLSPDVKLLLVGEGRTQQQCRDEVSRLKLEDRVLFLGNRSDVPRLLKTVDIVILSTLHEGVSLSSLEGMASGRPFIGTDAPGLSGTVLGAGILVPPSDAQAMADAISALLSDKELFDETVAACEQRASQYDINQTAQRYMALYQSIK